MVWFFHARGYWEDDAWIHLEFARSLSRGQGFVFNGRRVYGDTSPLWVWLLVCVHALIPSWMAAGKTLCALGAVFARAAVFVTARALTVARLGQAQARLFAATMVLLLAVNPFFGYWVFSGMEALTGAGLASIAAMIASRRPLPPSWLLAGAALAGIAPLLRPEMGFLSVLLGLVLAYRLWTLHAAAGTRLTLLAAGLALMLLPFGLWARYALSTFGSVLPTTNAAKRAGPGTSVLAHLVEIYALGFPLTVIGLLLLAAWAVMSLRRRAQRSPQPAPWTAPWTVLPAGFWLILAWCAVNALFYVVNHTYVQTRYVFVCAPVLVLVIMAGARVAWPRIYPALLAIGLVAAIAISVLDTWPSVANRVRIDANAAELAAYIRTLPPNAPVATYSIGELAFLSEHPIVDTGGITRPGIIPYLWDDGEARRTAWMYTQGAQYAVMGPQPIEGAVDIWERQIPLGGWFLNPRRYRETDHVILWKLPPRPAARGSAQAAGGRDARDRTKP